MNPTERMLDANLNRAREALRVMEDYARFALEDGYLSGTAKALRHELAQAVITAGLTGLIAARDIVGDVGREITGAGEYRRESLADVVVAAGKRATEALRVLEEAGKTYDASFGGTMERIRYGAYELERKLARRVAPARALENARLYVLITESLCTGGWMETAEAALRGGADVLQLREKGLSDRTLLDRARELSDLCHAHDAICVINDRPDLAMLAGADGVHVGQDDLAVADARRAVGADRIVGVSTHSLSQARRAIAAGPDYVAVGPMFETTTKRIDEVAGPELWSAVRAETSLPLVAIGGIDPASVGELVGLGCRWVCVCRAVIGAADPEAAARRMRGLMEDK